VTREELLVVCFGRDDFPPPMRTVVMEDERTGGVLSCLDLYLRTVRIRLPRSPRESIQDAVTTLKVPAIANLCTAPEYRGRQYERALVSRAHAELGEHHPFLFVAVCGPVDFYGPLGYRHPAGADREDFLVRRLRDDPWPAGRVRLVGNW
jgi:GNAT superfamily N-acetyltransferase